MFLLFLICFFPYRLIFPEKMKVRLIFSILFLSSLVFSCGLVELADFTDNNDKWISQVPSIGHLYAIGVSYPEDYDWRSDPEKGEVACSLVVLLDGRSIMRIAAGDKHQISTDPDMIRMIGGNLYTDYSTFDRTIVKKNGVEIFSYLGRESMSAFVVDGEDVYTLGNSRDGLGMSFRKNGNLIYKDSKARAFPHLDIKDGLGRFCFEEYHGESLKQPSNWCFFNGKSKSVISLPNNTYSVDDALFCHDQIVSILRLKDSIFPYLYYNGDLLLLHTDQSTFWGPKMSLSYSLDGHIRLHGILGSCTAAFGDEKGINYSFHGYSNILGINLMSQIYLCYLSAYRKDQPDAIFLNGKIHLLPKGFRAMGQNPVSMWQGQMYVALNPEGEGTPVIWTEKGMLETGINGCLYDLYVMD